MILENDDEGPFLCLKTSSKFQSMMKFEVKK